MLSLLLGLAVQPDGTAVIAHPSFHTPKFFIKRNQQTLRSFGSRIRQLASLETMRMVNDANGFHNAFALKALLGFCTIGHMLLLKMATAIKNNMAEQLSLVKVGYAVTTLHLLAWCFVQAVGTTDIIAHDSSCSLEQNIDQDRPSLTKLVDQVTQISDAK